jgi:hypothetical protein
MRRAVSGLPGVSLHPFPSHVLAAHEATGATDETLRLLAGQIVLDDLHDLAFPQGDSPCAVVLDYLRLILRGPLPRDAADCVSVTFVLRMTGSGLVAPDGPRALGSATWTPCGAAAV